MIWHHHLNLFVFWCLFNPNQNMNVLGTSAEILLYRNNLLLCQLDSDWKMVKIILMLTLKLGIGKRKQVLFKKILLHVVLKIKYPSSCLTISSTVDGLRTSLAVHFLPSDLQRLNTRLTLSVIFFICIFFSLKNIFGTDCAAHRWNRKSCWKHWYTLDEIPDEADIGQETEYIFAPGEGLKPVGLYSDPDAEYLSFPTIFCG
jgi:hypothetical protein